MYIICENSFVSEEPVYQKLPSSSQLRRHMFIPEARVAKDYVQTCFYERDILNWCNESFIN